MTPAGRPRIAVSACLLGQPVRFDGGHRRDRFVTEDLAPWVEFVPVCPEVEVGLGVPRETLRLVQTPAGVRLVAPRSGLDHTDRLAGYARARLTELRAAGVTGFLLKSGSPTCGLDRVRVYGPTGHVVGRARGRFAASLLAGWPDLPVEEEGRLRDPVLREHFLERVFALWTWQQFASQPVRPRDLVRFHMEEKLRLLAHDPARAAWLGRLVAEAARDPSALTRYGAVYAAALARPVTRARHVNVLQHAAGVLRRVLGPALRADLSEAIDAYRRGWVPLAVPVRLIRAWARAFGPAWLGAQRYLVPYPDALGLRNAV